MKGVDWRTSCGKNYKQLIDAFLENKNNNRTEKGGIIMAIDFFVERNKTNSTPLFPRGAGGVFIQEANKV